MDELDENSVMENGDDEISISSDNEDFIPTESTSLKTDDLPSISKRVYHKRYREFTNWQVTKHYTGITEPILLEYFREMSTHAKPNSLFAYYSILKRMVKLYQDVDISTYDHLISFLKQNSTGYTPRKSTVFTAEQIAKFISEAPDDTWLAVKTAFIFAVFGCLRSQNLRRLTVEDVVEDGEQFSVRIDDRSNRTKSRSFTISGPYYHVVKKYVALRPHRTPIDVFFVHYREGKCTTQPIGRAKFSQMAIRIARYLSLPDASLYNANSFRKTAKMISKSSNQIVMNVDVLMEAIKPHLATSKSALSIDNSKTVFASEICVDRKVVQAKRPANPISVEDKRTSNEPPVDTLRIHCTVCDSHIGCAVANETNVCTHPILRVTQCKDCQTFYNSRNFAIDDDGRESSCRWCGQGEQIYWCSKCPYVFCKKCILQNLSSDVIADIETNDNWACFSCSPNIIWRLRTQHFALLEHIRKTKLKIKQTTDANEIDELMNKDSTPCCKGRGNRPMNNRKRNCTSVSDSGSAKRISTGVVQPTLSIESSVPTLPTIVSTMSLAAPSTIPHQRQSSLTLNRPPPLCRLSSPSVKTMSNSSAVSLQNIGFPNFELIPIGSRTDRQVANQNAASQHVSIPQIAALQQVKQTAKATVQQITNPPAVVSQAVTPDMQSFSFVVDEDTYLRLPNGKLILVKANTGDKSMGTNVTHTIGAVQQPLQLQSTPNSQTPTLHTLTLPTPTFQTPTLQTPTLQTSDKDTYLRLPNGKLILVKTNTLNDDKSRNTNVTVQQPLQQQFNHQLQSTPNQLAQSIRLPMLQHSTLQTPTLQSPILPPQTVQSAHSHSQIVQHQPLNGLSTTDKSKTSLQPNQRKTPLGKARTELEKQIIGAREICQQIVGKCNSLMNSNAYNSVQNFNDVKDLHQHLSYLAAFALDKFTTLQTKCTDVMKSLNGTRKSTMKKKLDKCVNNAHDNIPLIAPKTECIDVDVEIKTEKLQSNEIAMFSIDELEIPSPPPLDSESYDYGSDEKLKSMPIVMLEKTDEVERKLNEFLVQEWNVKVE